MKAGDLVQLVGSFGNTSNVGVVLGPMAMTEAWLQILINEEVVQWPKNQLRLV